MKQKKNKAKIIALIAVSFVVFATTLFAMADNKTGNSLFLDSDQDGLTDQEEKMLGTDPENTDTDKDGYSDGKEVESGYNPLKAAPGDKIMTENSTLSSVSSKSNQKAETADKQAGGISDDSEKNDPTDSSGSAADTSNLDLPLEAATTDPLTDLNSDPNNPNLTNQMIGQLMQLTTDKVTNNSNFVDNPDYTADDYVQVVQNSLQEANISTDLPDIPDSELKILPEVSSKKLDEDEVKAKQKAEIEKYLAQVAFVFASNSPFPIKEISDLQPGIESESATLISALSMGNTNSLKKYADKAQAGIDQLKKIETPFVLKDIHKSMIQLSTYTLNLKDDITLNANDPMKSLTAIATIQSVAAKASQTQEDLSKILEDYGIKFINFPQ